MSRAENLPAHVLRAAGIEPAPRAPEVIEAEMEEHRAALRKLGMELRAATPVE